MRRVSARRTTPRAEAPCEGTRKSCGLAATGTQTLHVRGRGMRGSRARQAGRSATRAHLRPASWLARSVRLAHLGGDIMKCKDIMSTNLEWLEQTDTIQTAAQRMAEAGVGFLPICDRRRRVVGVVTDRDLATRAIAHGIAAATTSAALVMSAPALSCPPGTDIRE